MYPWNSTMNYNHESLTMARAKDREFNEFFQNIKIAIFTNEHKSEKWNKQDHEFHQKLNQLKLE